MKKIVLFLVVCIAALPMFAQAPQGINYQGVARNSIGAAISSTTITVQFKILQGTSPVYVETHNAPTDTFGLYSLIIGNGSPTLGTFSSILWGSGIYSIAVYIDPNGGTAYQFVATSQLQSVPYALYSGGSANGVTSVTANAPLSVINPNTTPTLSMSPANGSTDGFLSQTDWNTFNNKGNGTVTSITAGTGLAGGTFTNTGTIGLATVGTATTVGSSSVIPQITVDQYGRVTTITPQTFTSNAGTITSVSVTAPMTVTTPSTTPFISMPPANGGTDGFLSQTDWNTFNNKVSSISPGVGMTETALGNTYTISASTNAPIWNANQIQSTPVLTTTLITTGQVLQYNGGQWVNATLPTGLPSGVNGQVLYDSAGTWKGSNINNLFFNGTNMGIGTTTPAALLDITNNSGAAAGLNISMNGANGNAANFHITNTVSASNALDVTTNGTGNAGNFWITPTGTGNVINATTSGTGMAGNFAISNTVNAQPVVFATTNGTGIAGQFAITNAVNAQPAVFAATTGTGPAGQFAITNTVSAANALFVNTSGTGIAGNFTINNNLNSNPALSAFTNGTGNALQASVPAGSSANSAIFMGGAGVQMDKVQITNGANPNYVLTSNAAGNATWQPASGGLPSGVHGQTLYDSSGYWQPTFNLYNNGTNVGIGTTTPAAMLDVVSTGTAGIAGSFHITNAANGAHALYGGTNGAGNAVYGQSSGTGNAVRGYNYGLGSAGNFQINNVSNNTPALYATTNGTTTTSYSGKFSGGAGVQIDRLQVQSNINIPFGSNLGFVLTSDAAGNGTWQMPSTGVSSVTVNAPLTSSGGSTPVISIGTASATTSGYLTSGDWNLFNSKGNGSVTQVIAGAGLAGGTIINTGTIALANGTAGGQIFVTGASPFAPALQPMSGDVAITNAGATKVNFLQGTSVSSVAPATNQVLQYNGSQWAPGNAGTVGSIIGQSPALSGTVTTSGFITANNSTALWNANQLQTVSISSVTPTFNQILQYNGAQWVAALPAPPPVTGASNGLFLVGGSVELGGALTGNTTITQTANNMVFTATSGNVNINNSSAAPALSVSNGSTGGQAGNFMISSNINAANALSVTTLGTGIAGNFNINNAGNSNIALEGTTNGTGQAGYFQINNAANIQSALIATTNGTGTALQAVNTSTASGNAGYFNISNAANGSPSLYATTTGAGNAGFFNITNAANFQPSLYAATNGSGAAVQGFNSGTGIAGNFQITNTVSASNALTVSTNGTAGNAGNFQITTATNNSAALSASTNGAGNALIATTNGTGNAGSFNISLATNAQPALVSSTNGAGQAGSFAINNTLNNQAALFATTNGGGAAGNFNISNVGNSQPSLFATTNGTGDAGYFQITNAANNQPALNATTNGTTTTSYSGNFVGGAGLKTDAFTMTNGATANAVLTSNAGGNASWVVPPAPVNCNANATAGQTFIAATPANVSVGAQNYNNGGGILTLGTGNYSVPIAGIYHIDASVGFPNPASVISGSISILVNGATIRTAEFTSSVWAGGSFSAHISGDVIVPASGQGIQISITTLAGSPNITSIGTPPTSWFNVHLVR
ncbi:MAG TPA: hypothetical protein VF411_14070 [Bacteroidia bacterium]